MKVLFNIILSFLVIETVAAQCSLCPGGTSSIVNPGAKLGPSTCAHVESSLAGIPSAVCNAMTLSANFYFDYSAFCCSDVRSSSPSCAICSPGYEVLQDNIGTPTNNLVSTCGEAKEAADYAESTASCNILQEVGMSCCEQTSATDAPSKGPTPPPTPGPSPPPTEAPPTVSTSGRTEDEPTTQAEEPEETDDSESVINGAEEQQQQSSASGVSFVAISSAALVLLSSLLVV